MKLHSELPWQNSIQREEYDTSRQQSGLKDTQETSKVLHLKHSFLRFWKLDTLESRSEIPGK
jgi:hypothetical protein